MRKILSRIVRLFVQYLLGMCLCLTAQASPKIYLSMGCGGMFGLIPATLIAEVESQTGHPFYQSVDGVMGSSTGAIVGSLVTIPRKQGKQPYSGEEAVSFYRERGKEIFRFFPMTTAFLWDLFGLSNAHGEMVGFIQKQLDALFPTQKLSDSLVPLWIQSYDLTHKKHDRFDSLHAQFRAGNNTRVASAIQASGSVVQIFGPAQVEFEDGNTRAYIDPASIGVPRPVCNPIWQLYELVQRSLPLHEEAIIYSFETGFSQGLDAQSALGGVTTETFYDPRIKVVRFKPNLSTLYSVLPYSLLNLMPPFGTQNLAEIFRMAEINYLAAQTAEHFLDQLSQIAKALTETSEFAEMVQLLRK